MLEGIIARRVLLNFRVDPGVAQRLLPAPLTVDQHDGHAIAGICLIRLEKLRPKGMPQALGVASENMAQRIAIQYPSAEGLKTGVFIWRRDTDSALVEALGGRLFPGVHHNSQFRFAETSSGFEFAVKSKDGAVDVSFAAQPLPEWRATPAFTTFENVSDFFHRGECGFSCSLHGDQLEGMQLKMLRWHMEPLALRLRRAAFYQDVVRFPAGSVEFDCGLIMRGLPHEWHELREIPEIANLESR